MPACLFLMRRLWDESKWNLITHLQREKKVLSSQTWQIWFLTNHSANTHLWYTGSRHCRHLALMCHMHHVWLHAYMYVGEQVGSASGIPSTVICACDLSNSIQFSLQSAQNGEAKQINFGSAQRFLDSADAVICILQAHTFCTLISIFYNFWGLCLSSTLSFEKVWMHIKRYYYFNKAINLYLNAEPKVITAGEKDC